MYKNYLIKFNRMEKLDKIIKEHLMTLEFNPFSDYEKCTSTELAIYSRMKDVAIAYSDITNAKLAEENELLDVELKAMRPHFEMRKAIIEDLEFKISAAKERISELEKSLTDCIRIMELDNEFKDGYPDEINRAINSLTPKQN